MSLISFLTTKSESFMSSYPTAVKLFNIYYSKIVKNEIELGRINNKDKVLCIGGGPLPATALEIHRITGAQIHILDSDINAVKKSKKLIKNLGLSNRLKIYYANGSDFDITNFSVIHIAQQVYPKEEVVDNVLENASKNTRILVRVPVERLEKYYSEFDKNKRSYEKATNSQSLSFINSTILIEKKEGEYIHEKDISCGNRAFINNPSYMVS